MTTKFPFAFICASFLLLPLAPKAHAQSDTHVVEKHTTTTIIKQTDDDDDDYENETTRRHREREREEYHEGFHDGYHRAKPTETTITTRFGAKGQSGTAGCKTEDLAADAVKDLKGDCNAWVKDQKADLKDRYLTSNCEESCEDCGTGLKRCSVNGTVHYIVK